MNDWSVILFDFFSHLKRISSARLWRINKLNVMKEKKKNLFDSDTETVEASAELFFFPKWNEVLEIIFHLSASGGVLNWRLSRTRFGVSFKPVRPMAGEKKINPSPARIN